MIEQKAWTPDQPLRADATREDFTERWWWVFPNGGSEDQAWALAREFAAVSVEAVGKPTKRDALVDALYAEVVSRRNWMLRECGTDDEATASETLKQWRQDSGRFSAVAACYANPKPEAE